LRKVTGCALAKPSSHTRERRTVAVDFLLLTTKMRVMLDVSVLLWLAIGLFVLGAFVESYERELSAAGWVSFGAFWFLRIPIYLGTNSAIKIVLAVVALPLSVYVAHRVVTEEHGTLLKLGQAVAAMGLIYLPFQTVPWLNSLLIEHTAAQTNRVLTLLGVNAELVEHEGKTNLFAVTNPATGETYRTYIILACTGIGSMAMFGGLISVMDAPLRRRSLALGVVIPTIYTLNIARNVFISTAFGYQWFPFAENTVVEMTGKYDGYASFFWADKVISQSLSVVVLVTLLLVSLRFLPELEEILDDVLEMIGLAKKKGSS